MKSQLDLQDLEAVVKIGLDVILRSSDNFFVQVSSHFVLQRNLLSDDFSVAHMNSLGLELMLGEQMSW